MNGAFRGYTGVYSPVKSELGWGKAPLDVVVTYRAGFSDLRPRNRWDGDSESGPNEIPTSREQSRAVAASRPQEASSRAAHVVAESDASRHRNSSISLVWPARVPVFFQASIELHTSRFHAQPAKMPTLCHFQTLNSSSKRFTTLNLLPAASIARSFASSEFSPRPELSFSIFLDKTGGLSSDPRDRRIEGLTCLDALLGHYGHTSKASNSIVVVTVAKIGLALPS
ncbi:hypothetical protein BDN71DRAFT_1430836 [Pleurotus eryngii]|uniref:Uncharacterized protein n=1 Tax=Pleurotus eryngii TaxID=5323 RepID=A0A9P5ZZQ1_PLEER|nr:hypothetical protein BDN71DRAFT_1430836 [Pleurotus eryngii]